MRCTAGSIYIIPFIDSVCGESQNYRKKYFSPVIILHSSDVCSSRIKSILGNFYTPVGYGMFLQVFPFKTKKLTFLKLKPQSCLEF